MSKKEQLIKKGKDGKPTIKKIQVPEQPKMTEEQAFMSYTNQVISNAILDMESTKTRTVDALKSLIQQLSMYMNAVKKLEEEKKKLEDQLKKKK